MPNDDYRRGDFWLIDDLSGHRIRKSESRTLWNGLVVHKDDFETRHPQEFVRGRRDRQSVDKPRPEPVDVYGGPLTTDVTADAAAGAVTITVRDTTRFAEGDRIAVMLANNDRHLAIVQEVTSGTVLTLTAALPEAVKADTKVIDYSAVAADDIG